MILQKCTMQFLVFVNNCIVVSMPICQYEMKLMTIYTWHGHFNYFKQFQAVKHCWLFYCKTANLSFAAILRHMKNNKYDSN